MWQGIRELVERYSLAVTARDYELLRTCFAPEASWAVGDPINLKAEGRDAIVEFIRERQAMGSFSFQGVGAMVLDQTDDDAATGRVAIHEAALRGEDYLPLKLYGIYRDEFVCRDGEWRFLSRRCDVLNVEVSA